MWVAVRPAEVSVSLRLPELSVSRAWSRYSWIWVSVRPKVALAQLRTCSMPSVTLLVMSSSWLVSCEPTNESMPLTIASVPSTVMPAARPRGMKRASQWWIGCSSAARRSATTMGMTTSDSTAVSHRTASTPAATTSPRQAHSLAVRTPRGTDHSTGVTGLPDAGREAPGRGSDVGRSDGPEPLGERRGRRKGMSRS